MKQFFFVLMWGFYLSSCNLKLFGTNTGNPGLNSNVNAPAGSTIATAELSNAVCAEIANCFSAANANDCLAQIAISPGYTSALGPVAASYSTMVSLQTAETAGAITSSANAVQTCTQAISQLTCADPIVQSSYSSASPSVYADTNALFQASPACQQVF